MFVLHQADLLQARTHRDPHAVMHNLDVLSVGSESTTITDKMIEYAAQYRVRIVWMDKPEVAQRVAATARSSRWRISTCT